MPFKDDHFLIIFSTTISQQSSLWYISARNIARRLLFGKMADKKVKKSTASAIVYQGGKKWYSNC